MSGVTSAGQDLARDVSDLFAHDLAASVAGRVLLADVDVFAPGGAITAVVGPNGAGKSTLLATIARILGTGVVRLGSDDLDEISRRARARLVATMHQQVTDAQLTAREAVALGRIPHTGPWGSDPEEGAVAEALREVGAAHLADRLISTLSGGERQRVMLAMALAQRPRLLLVDEPSNHLDVSAQLEVMGILKALAAAGTTVLVALHDLALALEYADRAVMLKHGRSIASGSAEQVLTAERIREVYGVEVAILRDPESGRRAIAYRRASGISAIPAASARTESGSGSGSDRANTLPSSSSVGALREAECYRADALDDDMAAVHTQVDVVSV